MKIRDKEIRTALTTTSLSGTKMPQGRAAALRGRRRDPALAAARERPGQLPVHRPACSRSSARTRTRRGCSPARATRSAPTGASTCSPTACRRSGCRPRSTRSRSTATIPDRRPDIYGKVGNSGVSIATLDDMKVLYSGFDLCAPNNSVSMTINGPAPTILAMFMNTAIDQQLDKFRDRQRPRADRRRGRRRSARGRCRTVRGTVQADILKEDQGQNTCIFSTEFSAQGDGRHPGVLRPPRRAQLLFGVDLRLPHRRGRREPDHAARVHARPTASRSSRRTSRAACTSTTSRRTCRSSSATAWTPSTR